MKNQNIMYVCKMALKKEHFNSYYTRQDRMRILKYIVSDLAHLGKLPQKVEEVSCDHILALVDYWKQKLNTRTILNRLSVLRKINELVGSCMQIPEKTVFNLPSIKSWNTETPEMPKRDLSNDVWHPFVKNIIQMQIHFGLTRLEAIRVVYLKRVHKDVLYIDRNISLNQKTRIVPIVTEAQRTCLDERRELLEDDLDFMNFMSERRWSYLYRAELHWLGYPKAPNFRLLYIRPRFEALCREMPRVKALRIIRQEMGSLTVSKIGRLLV